MGSGDAGDMPLASVCISNHNYEHYLRAAIDSVLEQDYPNIEVIVADDASGDGSRAVIESYGARIRAVFNDRNMGQHISVSQAVACSRGAVVFLLDADDVFLPGKIGRIMEVWRAHPEASLIQHLLPNADHDLSRIARAAPFPSIEDIAGHLVRTDGHGFWYFQPTSAMAIPGELLRRLLPLPQIATKGEVDLTLALTLPHFGEVVSLDEVLALRRMHGENMFANKDRMAKREWALRDTIERTTNGLLAANEILARQGVRVRYRPERNPSIVEMRHQLGEASVWELARRRFGHEFARFGAGGFRTTWRTLRRSGKVRRRLRRRRRRGVPA